MKTDDELMPAIQGDPEKLWTLTVNESSPTWTEQLYCSDALEVDYRTDYWTLNDLDRPTTSWVSNTKNLDRRVFRNGYQGIQHRNLLRDSGYTNDTNDLPF